MVYASFDEASSDERFDAVLNRLFVRSGEFAAVSYTHLDVYKRQVLDHVGPWIVFRLLGWLSRLGRLRLGLSLIHI